MAHTYLSDPIEATWAQPEHETFVTLSERIEDMLAQQSAADAEYEANAHEFDSESQDCLMQTCYGPCYVEGQTWSY